MLCGVETDGKLASSQEGQAILIEHRYVIVSMSCQGLPFWVYIGYTYLFTVRCYSTVDTVRRSNYASIVTLAKYVTFNNQW